MSKRTHFTPEQKVAIVRRHLLEGVPVSDLCDELGILIWHDFMATAMESRKCDPFPEPTTPFESAPFFGEYASTGAPGGGEDPLAKEDGTDDGTTKDKEKSDKEKSDKKYPPSQYESPPQQAPKTNDGGDQQQSTPVAPTGGVGVG